MSPPTPFDSDAPLGSRRAIIRRNPADPQEVEMVEATWGSDPRFGDGASLRFVRSEGRAFPTNRCLVAASEFHIRDGERRFRVTLDGGNFFYLAAIWEPPLGDWTPSYRIITVAANPEVSRHQDRHGAIIQRRQVMLWLDHAVPEPDLLSTPSARTFDIEEVHAVGAQRSLAL